MVLPEEAEGVPQAEGPSAPRYSRGISGSGRQRTSQAEIVVVAESLHWCSPVAAISLARKRGISGPSGQRDFLGQKPPDR